MSENHLATQMAPAKTWAPRSEAEREAVKALCRHCYIQGHVDGEFRQEDYGVVEAIVPHHAARPVQTTGVIAPHEVCEWSDEERPCGPVVTHDEEGTPLCAHCAWLLNRETLAEVAKLVGFHPDEHGHITDAIYECLARQPRITLHRFSSGDPVRFNASQIVNYVAVDGATRVQDVTDVNNEHGSGCTEVRETPEEIDALIESAEVAIACLPCAMRGDSRALALVATERKRQREVEGWTDAHDDGHTHGEMAVAAAQYAVIGTDAFVGPEGVDGSCWIKHTNPIRNLVKAGALIIAEIERRQRAAHVPAPARDVSNG